MAKVILKKNHHLSKDGCTENNLNLGTYFNNIISIIKKNVSSILFNRQQFSVTNFAGKPNTAYVELNPDLIETLIPKIITGSTDNSLADNGIQVITPNVKNILVYDQQLEFVNSTVEPSTSTLKLKDAFVNSLLTEETDPIFTASPAHTIQQTDIDNWNDISSSGWGLKGNASIEPSTDFIGTTDFKPLIFKTDDNEAFRVNEAGQVEIGGSQAPYNFANLYLNGDLLQRNGGHYVITNPGQGVFQAQWGSTAQFAIRNDDSPPGTVQLDSLQGDLILNPQGSSNRKVGINTEPSSPPTATLDVNGSLRVRQLPNADGDITFIHNVVITADGTFGIKAFNTDATLTQVNNQYFASHGPNLKTNTIVYDTSSKSLAFSNGIEWIEVGGARPLLISSTVNIVADLYYDNFFVQNPITITIQGSLDALHYRNRQRKYYFTNSSNGNVTIIHSPNSGFLPPQPSVIIPIGETRVFTRTDDGGSFFVSKA